jgi:large subunit ribosomal protein L3
MKGGLLVSKQEMTKLWMDDNFVPATVVKILPQEIVRYKTTDKDKYQAVIIGTDKKEPQTKKWKKIVYKTIREFPVDDQFIQNNPVGKIIDTEFLKDVQSVDVIGTSKGKGFQGMVKKWHVKGMWATHGHKFTRTGWSKGNRKPRRTMKGHPHAGHMGTERVTLKNKAIIDTFSKDTEQYLVLKGSLPGARNGLLQLIVK